MLRIPVIQRDMQPLGDSFAENKNESSELIEKELWYERFIELTHTVIHTWNKEAAYNKVPSPPRQIIKSMLVSNPSTDKKNNKTCIGM